MFVYYKLYREPVSPTISTPRCGDQGKKQQSPALRLCTRRQEASNHQNNFIAEIKQTVY